MPSNALALPYDARFLLARALHTVYAVSTRLEMIQVADELGKLEERCQVIELTASGVARTNHTIRCPGCSLYDTLLSESSED